MTIPSHHKNVIQAAAFLGAVQGLGWSILASIAIVYYYTKQKAEAPASYATTLGYYIFSKFIDSTDEILPFTNTVVKPTIFIIFMHYYVVISAVWFILSVDLFICRKYGKPRLQRMMASWGLLTLVISLLDIILVGLLIKDYIDCGATATESNFFDPYCNMAVGIVMSLVARGYWLWMLNLIFAYIMIKISVQEIRSNRHPLMSQQIVIPRAKAYHNKSWTSSLGKNIFETRAEEFRRDFVNHSEKFFY